METPPIHAWYNRQVPGVAFNIKADRVIQITNSRFANRHIKYFSFDKGQKSFLICSLNCNSEQAISEQLVKCVGLDRDGVNIGPRIVYDIFEDCWDCGLDLPCSYIMWNKTIIT
ncbi:hypothetical protein CDAR_290861 [Caerostris darwini]|uniref:Uncharacterized protein n=1 Tax=Caerostris darwini TaxID=1538125 RepID=A0AAV4VMY0_9ARAC|nr:hypothetical protein CDAR_290861 [Caerostris darwini]